MGTTGSMYYSDELQKLQEQVERKKKLNSMMEGLKERLYELEKKVDVLEKRKLSEDKDVEKIEGHSLAAFFYGVVGKKDAKLDKERQEAYEATVKYNTAKAELEELREDIRRNESELMCYAHSEDYFEQKLMECMNEAKKSGGASVEKVTRIERELNHIENQKKEVHEAYIAGQRALNSAENILANLDGAGRWGIYDVLGGGLIADLAKYEYLDNAEDEVKKLQIELMRFQTELADIKLDTIPQIEQDDFLKFADYFFDGIIADWTVLSRIKKSKEQAEVTWSQISDMLEQLDIMKEKLEQRALELKNQLGEILIKMV